MRRDWRSTATAITSAVALGTGATTAIIQSELARALPVLLDNAVPFLEKPDGNALVVGTLDELAAIGVSIPKTDCRALGEEGFLIRSQRAGDTNRILIAGNSAPAVLTGVFHFCGLSRRTKTSAHSIFRAVPGFVAAYLLTGTILTARSNAAMPGARCGTGTRCRKVLMSDTAITRALVPPLASMEPA